MKQNELFSYVYDFVSQILENKVIFNSIKKIVLFGSIVRCDFSAKSDVDLFIDIKSSKEKVKINNLVKNEINKFESHAEKTWFLRGIHLPIKAIVDDLEQSRWDDLREEILTYGKLIYGKFEVLPKEMQHKILIIYDIKKLSQKKKMSFIRKLYGYSLKKGSKKYVQKGLIELVDGEKLNPGTLVIIREDWLKIKKIFQEYKIKYRLKDIWSK